MDSLCGAFDCLACLKDGRYWLELLNHTKCCIWNAATFDISYEMLLQPGDEDMCPAVYSSNALSVSLGCLAGIGALAGIGVGISCWIRSRRLQGRLALADEETRRLMEISSRRNCCDEVGAEGNIVDSGRFGLPHKAIVPIPLQQQRAEPETVALYSARSRSSLAALPYHVIEEKNEDQRGKESKALMDKKWKHFGGGSQGGSRRGGSGTTDHGAKNEMEMYEMIPL